jgi:hypothetical protein
MGIIRKIHRGNCFGRRSYIDRIGDRLFFLRRIRLRGDLKVRDDDFGSSFYDGGVD